MRLIENDANYNLMIKKQEFHNKLLTANYEMTLKMKN